MELDADTLERLVPDQLDASDLSGLESLRLHLERYEFAAAQAVGGQNVAARNVASQKRPGRLLDMACGAGYGTRLLADARPELGFVLGVDLSPETVAYASQRYGDDRIRFLAGDAMQFSDTERFDTVVSLETVEHVPDPPALFARLVGLLAPGGVLVSSVPTTPSVDLNPHHLHDFTDASFRRLGAAHELVELAELRQVQSMRVGELLRGGRFRRSNLRPGLPGYYLRNPAALAKRAAATLRFGLANHYLTVAWQRSSS